MSRSASRRLAAHQHGQATWNEVRSAIGGRGAGKPAVIDDAGHLMNMEQPEVFNRLLTDFIRTIKHEVSEARP